MFDNSQIQLVKQIILQCKELHIWGFNNDIIEFKSIDKQLITSSIRKQAFKKKQINIDQMQKDDFTYEFMIECASLKLLDNECYKFFDYFYFESCIQNKKLEEIFLIQIVSSILENDKNIYNIPEIILQKKEINDYLVKYTSDNTQFVSFECCGYKNNNNTCHSFWADCMSQYCGNPPVYHTGGYCHIQHIPHCLRLVFEPNKSALFGIIFDSLPNININDTPYYKFVDNIKYLPYNDIETHIQNNISSYSKYVDLRKTCSECCRLKYNNKSSVDLLYKNNKVNKSIIYNKLGVNTTKIHQEFYFKICIELSKRKTILMQNTNNNKITDNQGKILCDYNEIRKNTISNFGIVLNDANTLDYKKYYILNYDFSETEKDKILKIIIENNFIDCIEHVISKDFYKHDDFTKYHANLSQKYWIHAFDTKKISLLHQIPLQYHHLFNNKITINNILHENYDYDINAPHGQYFCQIATPNSSQRRYTNIRNFYNFIKKLTNNSQQIELIKRFACNDGQQTLNHAKIKNITDFTYNDNDGYRLISNLVKNDFYDDKNILFKIISDGCSDELLNEILNKKIMFDFYDYNPNTKHGFIFLKIMMEKKHYRPNNKLTDFIEKSENSALIFDIAIKTGFIDKKNINNEYLMSFEKKRIVCDNECVICYEIIQEKMVLVPCGHTNICKICFAKIKKLQCPICTNNVTMQIKIFE
ncbi:RING-finger domain-containing protein [Bodo saltans virus]|uniref:RING-finger domain-containing protein n=1 Tax=Bodo saltans virus TaxID=2024608 RepID=A0A2H4UW25_9VIRU|nr:RING-finger domain-containing protein [Bodo saltans virus]ATZ81076.1 RING-finger domain-containing protein [Bodo saltans virus]